MTSHTNPKANSSSPKRKMAQNSSDRLSKIPKLKVPTSTPTDPSQPHHSRSRNLPQAPPTTNTKHHHDGHPHPHHGFIHPPHDATLFSPTNTASSPSHLRLGEVPGVIPPFTSPTVAQSDHRPFSDQDSPAETVDAVGLGAAPNLASELEEALIEEVQKNPGLTRGVHIEDLVGGGEGGSNLTPGEVGGVGIDVEVEVGVGVGVEDEITWESDEDEEEHKAGENDEESIASDSDSRESSDSGYDGKLAARNEDTVMGCNEGYEEEEDGYRGIGTGGGRGDRNDMSNDINVDPYAGRATKSRGEDDVTMVFRRVDGEWDEDRGGVWDGVEALEPGEDEAVDGYERTGEGVERHVGDDFWW
ncbi:hypothetical protein EYC80_008270 [Monilinia laxa]|uniref:Uncharacterized protein n=1 Tax=Monilinia laxa TaxID=61186 RepID=A0A5N6JU16_MONLA|nr:hypothetical protein EYC80_008270 [Monilinia laxa]